MIIEMYIGMRHTTEYSETLTKEQRKYALEQMTKQFCELMECSPNENLYWLGSTTDLLDLAHEVYMTERLVDREGRPFPFKRIVKRACDVLHVPMPSNPYSMAFNARNRKGVRQTSMFSRYCWQMFFRGSKRPLREMVKRV